jgi:hypothetical protein
LGTGNNRLKEMTMNIKKGKWQAELVNVTAGIPSEFADRVVFERDGAALKVLVGGQIVVTVVETVGFVTVEPSPYEFRLGTRASGHQLDDLRLAVGRIVERALGLKRDWDGNLCTLDGFRLDGRGRLKLSPLEEALEAIEGLEASDCAR